MISAFCLGDVRFLSSERTYIDLTELLLIPEARLRYLVKRCEIRFRTQKNGNHGKKRLLVWSDHDINAVLCMIRVVKRFIRLVGWDYETPLAVYQDTDGTIRYMSSAEVETVMRDAAANVYDLDPAKHKDELKRWSSHSLRVGACTLLFTHGFTETQIKFLLRWKSDSFVKYLRNLGAMVFKQSRAINTVLPDGEYPNFL